MAKQSRPWLSLAALLALAGCCMSPPSPVDGVPYGGWIGGGPSSRDRATAPEPVAVPADSSPDSPASNSESSTSKEPPAVIIPRVVVSTEPAPAKASPVKPTAKVDPLREPLRLPLAAIDRSPSLTVDKGIRPMGVTDAAPRIAIDSSPSLATGTAVSPVVGVPSGKPSALVSSSAGLNVSSSRQLDAEKNPTLHLGSPMALNPVGINENKVQVGEVGPRTAKVNGEGSQLTLSLPSQRVPVASTEKPKDLKIAAAGTQSSSGIASAFQLGVNSSDQTDAHSAARPVTIQVATGTHSKVGATASDTPISVTGPGSAPDLKSGAPSASLQGEIGKAKVRSSLEQTTSASLAVEGAQALPVPGVASPSALSIASAAKLAKSSTPMPVEIFAPNEPSVHLNETQKTPTLKTVSPPRTTEIKVSESVAVKTGNSVVRVSQGVPSTVPLNQSVSQPLTGDRSAPISAGKVLHVTAPSDSETARREEEKRLREEELRSHESSLRQWLHDHLPLLF